MLPKSTFEIVIEEDILYFKDVWAYMDSGIVGDVISITDQLELEWNENFENVTSKVDDNIWVSVKVPYIKHCADGLKKMQLLSDMNDCKLDKIFRNNERLRLAREKIRIKQKNKVKKLGEMQYKNNILYRMKVDTLLMYALSSKYYMHSFLLHSRFLDFKLGLYISCLSLSVIMAIKSKSICSELIFSD